MIKNVAQRPELNPFEPAHFILCEKMFLAGMELKFGDQVPEFADLFHVHTHYNNGVVGTKKELDSLVKPIELAKGFEDPLMPVAKFVHSPAEAQAPIELAEERGVFAMQNAKLLKTKDDLIAYAKEFDIVLKKSSAVSLAKLLTKLEAEAIKKGLIES